MALWPLIPRMRISIHALREEGDLAAIQSIRQNMISIHALREEGDDMGPRDRRSPGNFYPRPPRGGRHTAAFSMTTMSRFLSTPSARRATKLPKLSSDWIKISIHALREEGDPACSARSSAGYHFYPRPPRGGRLNCPNCPATGSKFLSTPSARRATQRARHDRRLGIISIHALREEGDQDLPRNGTGQGDFYPRPPRGGRLHLLRLWSD